MSPETVKVKLSPVPIRKKAGCFEIFHFSTCTSHLYNLAYTELCWAMQGVHRPPCSTTGGTGLLPLDTSDQQMTSSDTPFGLSQSADLSAFHRSISLHFDPPHALWLPCAWTQRCVVKWVLSVQETSQSSKPILEQPLYVMNQTMKDSLYGPDCLVCMLMKMHWLSH